MTFEDQVAELLDAVPGMLQALRVDGTCVACKVASGVPHGNECPAWPFIAARERVEGRRLVRVDSQPSLFADVEG